MASKTLITLLLVFLAAAAVTFITFKQYRWWADFARDMTSFFTGEDTSAGQPESQYLDKVKPQPEAEDAGSPSEKRET